MPTPPPKIKARSSQVRDLTVDVPVTHLSGPDVPVVRQKNWLPSDPFFGLQTERAEHHRLIDEIERAENALRALRQEVVEERQHRTRQLADGTAGGRPRPNAQKLVQEAEELAVAAQARLIAFADRTLAVILERLPQWQAELARRDAQSRERVRQAERALRDAQEEAGQTNLARRWSERQTGVQVGSWAELGRERPAPERNPELADAAKRMGGW